MESIFHLCDSFIVIAILASCYAQVVMHASSCQQPTSRTWGTFDWRAKTKSVVSNRLDVNTAEPAFLTSQSVDLVRNIAHLFDPAEYQFGM